MPLTTVCTGNPFPGVPGVAQEFGTCDIVQLLTFLNSLSTTCSASFPQLQNPATLTPAQLEGALDDVCQPGCSGEVAPFLTDTCQAPFLSNLIGTLSCYVTDGELGSRCFVALQPGLRSAPFFANAESTCFGDPDTDFTQTCPNGCQEALLEIQSQLGCCYQSIYNDSTTLDLLLINDNTITFDDRAFFDLLGTQALWDRCEVPLQEACGALQLAAASTMLVLCVIIFTIFV